MSSTTISVPGIHCDHCKASIEGALGALDGVERAEVDVAARTVAVDYDDAEVSVDQLRNAILDQGYDLPG